MKIYNQFDSPFYPVISFHAIIEDWERRLEQHPEDLYTKNLLDRVKQKPELKEGFEDFEVINQNKEIIAEIMSCVFPSLLTNTDISAATFPWSNKFFNPTKLFEKLILQSGKEFCINNNNFDKDSLYIANCSIILSQYYNVPISNYFPLYFEFRTEKGINKHYRIVYNADFLEISPTETATELSPKDIDLLLDNPNDIELWKEKIPSQSWLIKGFGIMSMIDTTVETAFSNLKQNLVKSNLINSLRPDEQYEILKSIFNVCNIDVGISNYDFESNKFVLDYFNLVSKSLIVNQPHSKLSGFLVRNSIFRDYIANNKPMIVSNIPYFLERYPDDEIIKHLNKAGFKSCALIPIRKDDKFLGVTEFASENAFAFNSLTTYRVNMIYSFLADQLERGSFDFSNLKSSIIQQEYTRLHPSVAWKFDKEVENYLKSQDNEYVFKEIVFRDVNALYGEVDIQNSSDTQAFCIQSDIEKQLKSLFDVLDYLYDKTKIELLQQKKFELKQKYKLLNQNFKASSEIDIQQYIGREINPILTNSNIYHGEEGVVADYLRSLDPNTGRYYQERKKFDDSVNSINKKFTQIIDERQKEIQSVFPHYFERFKTDGVDHTIYIGSSISPKLQYTPIYLQNVRLWQLQVTCEMLKEHQKIKSSLPIPLEVTSMILAFNQPISIRFRMDEKRFDVDGSYNAQYEVLKKRIDKSHIKGTKERLTQAGKIAIVYTNSSEEIEYLTYIKFLQSKGKLKEKIELLDLENYQGITGLKALRVELEFSEKAQSEANYYTYDELIQDLN